MNGPQDFAFRFFNFFVFALRYSLVDYNYTLFQSLANLLSQPSFRDTR
jgi:hypothetical protein